MKIHALLNLYNDRAFLGACLDSLIGNVDSLIVADGAYKLYYEEYRKYDPMAKPWSTDGSMELIKAVKDLPDLKIIKSPSPEANIGLEGDCWQNQAVKRTALLNEVPDGDWFLIIDADVMIKGDIQEGLEQIYESGCICANMPVYNPGTDIDRFQREWHPSVFEKMPGMHYKGTHWHLRDKYNRIIEAAYPIYWSNCMALIHFKAFKTQERLLPHENYMQKLATQGWIEPMERKINV
jgi:hypothetical protein